MNTVNAVIAVLWAISFVCNLAAAEQSGEMQPGRSITHFSIALLSGALTGFYISRITN